jgi:ADP-heptose:LPS heptosyltransferase
MLAGMLLAAERIVRKRTREVEPTHVRRVLVLEYRLPLGCLVHMTPALEAMKRARDGMELTVATCGLGLEVLRHSPMVDSLIAAPDPTAGLGAAVRGLRGELRRRGIEPDCVLTGASDQRTKIALMGMLAVDAWRGGYTLQPALYHRPLAYDPDVSLIENNLRLARLLGCQAERVEPRVYFSAGDAVAARELLRAANPAGRPLVTMVTQASGGQRTGWHTERFAEVVRAAAARGCAVVYVGMAGDAAAIEQIRAAAGGVGQSIAGRTTVNELAAVLALSDHAVTLDTGTMHVGRAVGVPMVVLGPSWQRPVEWMPLGVENVRILRGEDRADVPERYRLDEISAASAVAALDELMVRYPASAEAREARVARSVSAIDHLAHAVDEGGRGSGRDASQGD